MSEKTFKLNEDQLLDLIEPMGGCMATDKITVEGLTVGYMYRDEPADELDSGWTFFSGTEDERYLDNEDNMSFHEVNTIANYDKAIIPYLEYPVGSRLERVEGTDAFELIVD